MTTKNDQAHVASQSPLGEQATGGQAPASVPSVLPWVAIGGGTSVGIYTYFRGNTPIGDPVHVASCHIAGRAVDAYANAAFIVRACNAHHELLAALTKLANEAAGFLGAFDGDLRLIAGHTNVNVLRDRVDEAREVLAKVNG